MRRAVAKGVLSGNLGRTRASTYLTNAAVNRPAVVATSRACTRRVQTPATSSTACTKNSRAGADGCQARWISSSRLGTQIPKEKEAAPLPRKAERSFKPPRKKPGMNLEQLLDRLSRSELESLVQQGKVFVPTAYSMPVVAPAEDVLPVPGIHLDPAWQDRVMSQVKIVAADADAAAKGILEPYLERVMAAEQKQQSVDAPAATVSEQEQKLPAKVDEEKHRGFAVESPTTATTPSTSSNTILLTIPGTDEVIPLLLSSVLKKRRLKIKKHKHRKRLKLKRKNTKASRA